MYLTIQEFSKRTGLPPSRLRFYDKKGLIQPTARLENGYRAYSVDQVHLAKMIDSLRQADISIPDIKLYSVASEKEKKILLDKWKKDLNRRIDVLLAAKKYIGGINVENPQTLLLSKWETAKSFVWQRFEADRSPHPFRQHFITAKCLLEEQGIQCSNQIYLKNESITKDKIIGEIGFEVSNDYEMKDNKLFRYEQFPPTLFAILQDCKAEDAFLCFSYIQVIIRYGFQPAGAKIERYSSIDDDSFDYLIPLVN
ncbi:helix-turn-helix domain-containing protein [Bacillus ndiopicus]|uniref:helix-turn-helix domain-containing protein n=1 Tax=Bacillus ndiopicus TaxID=1347368 RepID=UPI0005A7EFAE|nr:MerR family transcriptional regulator [Bacillus ndiopicus]